MSLATPAELIPITFRSDMSVHLIDNMGGDERVIRAAKVSTEGDNAISFDTLDDDLKKYIEDENDEIAQMTEDERFRFIDFLVRNRHGSPFEHLVSTFFIGAPIFVWREIMRHRMASYNEESGRYKVLESVFYLPGSDRKLVQVGRTGAYTFVDGSPEQHTLLDREMREAAREDTDRYHRLLDEGIAKEVARMTLPLNIYSHAWMTLNSRSLMNFLSLRVKSEISTYPSFPQREIEMVAEVMEEIFAEIAPLTYRSFIERGRVSP